MYIYDVSIRRKPLVCGLHGNQTKKRSSTTNRILKKYETLSHYMNSEKPIENDGVLLVQFWFVVKDGILHVRWLFTACCWKTEKKNLKDKLNMTGHVIITFNAQLRRY